MIRADGKNRRSRVAKYFCRRQGARRRRRFAYAAVLFGARTRMAVRALAAAVLLWLAPGLGLSILQAGEGPGGGAELGSPDFRPSPECAVGWRGDGSGRFPGATPPVHWERMPKPVKALRSQAAKPKEGETGKPIQDGVIREWLALGPQDSPDGVKPDKDFLPDESQWSPDEGEKVGGLAWKKVVSDIPVLDFKTLFGATAPVKAVAYAHAYVYAENAQPFTLRWMASNASDARLLCNGKKWEGKLEKGWNRLLFRVTCGIMWGWQQDKFADWYLRQAFFGDKTAECDERNIAWRVRLPGWSIAQPVVVGDRLFANGNCRTLYCLDKKDGRILWAKTVTYADVATDDEKKAHPDIFRELEPLLKELREKDAARGTGEAAGEDAGWKKIDLERKIAKLMVQVDREKYQVLQEGEGGVCAPVPTSDGRLVCAVYQDLFVCFDLDGNQKWLYKYPDMTTKAEQHGYFGSPRLIGGKAITCFFNPLRPKLVALDAATGAEAWTYGPSGYYASMLGLTIDKEPVLATPYELLRAGDGKLLALLSKNGPGCTTPVIHDRVMFRLGGRSPGEADLLSITFPAALGETAKAGVEMAYLDVKKYPRYFTASFTASPLYHDGLVYCVNEDGVLAVVDAAKREVAYQKMLDLELYMTHSNCPGRGGCCSSPALAGRYVYIFGNRGTCLVIEPGREYRQVARNRIESIVGKTDASWGGTGSGDPASTASCPTFDGSRLYYRALDSLYCIEEKTAEK